MSPEEIEAFLTANRVSVLGVMRAINEPGWRLSLRVPPGSPLHRPEVYPGDSFRIFVAPTLEGCWTLAKAAVPVAPAAPVDPMGAFG